MYALWSVFAFHITLYREHPVKLLDEVAPPTAAYLLTVF